MYRFLSIDGNLVVGHTYTYYVTAVNAGGSSLPSNTVTVAFSMPAAPTGLRAVVARVNENTYRVTLTWKDNANNGNGFQIQRSTSPNFNALTTYTVGANLVSLARTCR